MTRGTSAISPTIGLISQTPKDLAQRRPGSPPLGRDGLRALSSQSHGARVAPAIKLVLIGGGRLMRDATASLLAAQEGLEVEGTYESAAHFLAGEHAVSPAILLLDCDGDPGVWRSAVSVLGRTHAGAKLAMLCQELSEEAVSCAVEHRVSGVILKSYSTEDIRETIRYMASGRTIMPAGWQRAATPARSDALALSPRLRQILTLIAHGASNEQIAADLALSPNTIKFHVRALYGRLGVHSRVAAAIRYEQLTRGGD